MIPSADLSQGPSSTATPLSVNGRRTKIIRSRTAALAGVRDGMTVAVGGWGGIGVPGQLIETLATLDVHRLRIITNNCGMGMPDDVGLLFEAGQVESVVATYPSHPGAKAFRRRLERNEIGVEIIPQGTFAERLRAAGSGIGGFFTRVSAGTILAEGKESRIIDGAEYVLEPPLPSNFALIKAHEADEAGNLRFRYAARGLNPVMAMSARTTIVQADHVVPIGSIHPDDVHLPGVFVDRVVATENVT